MKTIVRWTAPLSPSSPTSTSYEPQLNLSWHSPAANTPNGVPTFGDFFTQWRAEKLPEWRRLHRQGVDDIASKHLLPWFGAMPVNCITRQDVLQFRAHLSTLPGYRGRTLSASRINKIFAILRPVLAEAAIRHRFVNPTEGIRKLKAKAPEIYPFTLAEVELLCREIRPDYRDYLGVRLFSGMRTGEINGLKWHRMCFDRNILMVRETFSAGQAEEDGKTEGSLRDIPMLPPVLETLIARRNARVGSSEYVFEAPMGGPIDAKNFANRIYYPLLDRLGIARRRPYQTRHTTATLLLASGENPEWIARFLGHSSTEMLFRVYSRYVPNLTRHDGSAVAAMLSGQNRPRLHQGED